MSTSTKRVKPFKHPVSMWAKGYTPNQRVLVDWANFGADGKPTFFKRPGTVLRVTAEGVVVEMDGSRSQITVGRADAIRPEGEA